MLKKSNPNIKLPGNESPEHFILKQVAKLYLNHNQMCKWVADEIRAPWIWYPDLPLTDEERETHNFKKTTDVLGLQKSKGEWTIKNAEVKVSRNDLKSGYCVAGEYNYLITPPGLVEKDEVLHFFGIVEVDFDEFNWKYFKDRPKGIKSIKRAKRIEFPVDKEDVVETLTERLLNKLSNKQIYKNPWLWPGVDLRRYINGNKTE